MGKCGFQDPEVVLYCFYV